MFVAAPIDPPWHGREINTYSYSRTHAFESMGRDCLEEAQKEGGGRCPKLNTYVLL
jgi:hypothetical protein